MFAHEIVIEGVVVNFDEVSEHISARIDYSTVINGLK